MRQFVGTVWEAWAGPCDASGIVGARFRGCPASVLPEGDEFVIAGAPKLI